MDIDPSIYFIIVVPDGSPAEATPMQGFALSLCQNSWAIRAAASLPSTIFDLTDEGRETLLARRMSGTYPVHWYGQSPKAIRSIPNPSFIPFSLVILPESESPKDYAKWAGSSPLRPTIVAKSEGDLSHDDLTLDGLQAHFLKVCDRMPNDIDLESVARAREAIRSWKQMPERKLDYQVGGHNSIIPNLVALRTVGFTEMVYGPFKEIKSGIKPYADQIVQTANSILDERDIVGERDFQRIFRKPPDLNLFAPAIYPSFFDASLARDADRDEKKRIQVARQTLMRQTGYNFEFRTEAQQAAVMGVRKLDGEQSLAPNSLMLIRARELSLSTELMGALASSQVSAVVRLPNEINRTLGTVRNFSEHCCPCVPHEMRRPETAQHRHP